MTERRSIEIIEIVNRGRRPHAGEAARTRLADIEQRIVVAPVYGAKRERGSSPARSATVVIHVEVARTHGDHIGNVGLFPESTVLIQRAEYKWISSPDGPNDNVNQLKALARKLMGTPKHLRLLDGDTDVFGDGSVTLISTPGHTPGSQSLLVHLKNSGFVILSGDVVHLEENFEKNTVPSLNTDRTASIASMERIRKMIATYKAKFFINHDKAESDALKLIPAFYD